MSLTAVFQRNPPTEVNNVPSDGSLAHTHSYLPLKPDDPFSGSVMQLLQGSAGDQIERNCRGSGAASSCCSGPAQHETVSNTGGGGGVGAGEEWCTGHRRSSCWRRRQPRQRRCVVGAVRAVPRVPMLLVVIQREQLRGQGTSATATPSMIDCDLPGKPLGTSAFTPHAPHLFNQIERKKNKASRAIFMHFATRCKQGGSQLSTCALLLLIYCYMVKLQRAKQANKVVHEKQ